MARVIHRFQGFENLEDAKAFKHGKLLTPKSRGDNRSEYQMLGAFYLDTNKYPYVRVWNEVGEYDDGMDMLG